MPAQYQDQLDDNLLFERIESFGGGVDGFTRSTLLPPDVSRVMSNMIVRDNMEAITRPGADALGGVTAGAGLIQGLRFYSRPAGVGPSYLLAAVAAGFVKWDGTNWSTVTGWTLPDATRSIEIEQGIDTLLVSDGTNSLQSWNGTAWTVESTPDANLDPPSGATILCWHTGRMFAAGFAGSAANKQDDAIWVSNLLAFGKGQWNATTRQFRVGSGKGDPIMGLASFAEFTLAVLKQNSIWLVTTDPTTDPANWRISTAPETISYGVGCVGKKAWCVYGNDLLFFAQDGVRTLQRMQAATGQYQLSAPFSLPVQSYIDRINWDYASGICAVKYKEYALFAVPLDSSTSNNYVLVWNGRLGKWLGAWEGWSPTMFEVTRFNGNQRLVIGDQAGNVNQWKEWSDKGADSTYTENGNPFASRVYTRSSQFGEPINSKDPYHCEVRVSGGNTILNVSAVTDEETILSWPVPVTPSGPQFPVTLPFTLGSIRPVTVRRGLRGLPDFNEIYLRLESPAGWFSVRNITLSAYLNTIDSTGTSTADVDDVSIGKAPTVSDDGLQGEQAEILVPEA